MVAGSPDPGELIDGEPATSGRLETPVSLLIDDRGDLIIAERSADRVRKVVQPGFGLDLGPDDVPDGSGPGSAFSDLGSNLRTTESIFENPQDLAIDADGVIYVADTGNNVVRRIDATTGMVTTVVGTGTTPSFLEIVHGFLDTFGTLANITGPAGIAVDSDGILYVSHDKIVRRLDATGVLRRVAGGGSVSGLNDGGPATNAVLEGADGIDIDADGNLYIADPNGRRVRRVDTEGTITTVAGNGTSEDSGDGGPATDAGITPFDVAADGEGNLYIVDSIHHRVRKVDPDGVITAFAGTGEAGLSLDDVPATESPLSFPHSVSVDPSGNVAISSQSAVITVNETGTTRLLSSESFPGAEFGILSGHAFRSSGVLLVLDRSEGRVLELTFPIARQIILTVTPTEVTLNDIVTLRIEILTEDGMTDTGDSLSVVSISFPVGFATIESSEIQVTGGTATVDIQPILAGDLSIQAEAPNASSASISVTVQEDPGTPGGSDSQGPPTASGGPGTVQTVVSRNLRDGFPATEAPLFSPVSLALQTDDRLAIYDETTSSIRVVDLSTGIISTLNNPDGDLPAGGLAISDVRIQNNDVDLAASNDGGLLMSFDSQSVVWFIDPAGVLSHLAGSLSGSFAILRGFDGDGGPATQGLLAGPQGLHMDAEGNVYVADEGNHRVRQINPNRIITTVAGSGPASASSGPQPAGDFAGDNGPSTNARLNNPNDVVTDGDGNIYITDFWNGRIRKVTPSGTISTVAGNGSDDFSGDDGAAVSAGIRWPRDIDADSDGNLYIIDGYASRVRKIDPGGNISTIAGSGSPPENALDGSSDDGTAIQTRLRNPSGLAVRSGGDIYLGETGRVRKVDTSGGITTIAGGYTGDGGPASDAVVEDADDVFLDSSGNAYVAESSGNRIRRLDAQTGVITTIAGTGVLGYRGDGGPATLATLGRPRGLFVTDAGEIYFSDSANGRIRKIDASGTITSVVGGGTSDEGNASASEAQLILPDGTFVDASGEIYFAEPLNHWVRRYDPVTGMVSVVAGTGEQGTGGNGSSATSATLDRPVDVWVTDTGELYIAVASGVRRVGTDGRIFNIAGMGNNPVVEGATAVGPRIDASGIFVDESGTLVIAMQDGLIAVEEGRIRFIGGGGTQTDDGWPATETEIPRATAVAVSPDGTVWFTDRTPRLARILPDTSSGPLWTAVPQV